MLSFEIFQRTILSLDLVLDNRPDGS